MKAFHHEFQWLQNDSEIYFWSKSTSEAERSGLPIEVTIPKTINNLVRDIVKAVDILHDI